MMGSPILYCLHHQDYCSTRKAAMVSWMLQATTGSSSGEGDFLPLLPSKGNSPKVVPHDSVATIRLLIRARSPYMEARNPMGLSTASPTYSHPTLLLCHTSSLPSHHFAHPVTPLLPYNVFTTWSVFKNWAAKYWCWTGPSTVLAGTDTLLVLDWCSGQQMCFMALCDTRHLWSASSMSLGLGWQSNWNSESNEISCGKSLHRNNLH